jgi:hypothetical protein
MREIASPHRSLRLIALLLTLSAAQGCASGFRFETLTSQRHDPTSSVEFIQTKPARPYLELARFRGIETALCAPDQPYCSLRSKARQLGADAIWIQSEEVWQRPQRTVVIEGKATVIPAADYKTVEGVFVRYAD